MPDAGLLDATKLLANESVLGAIVVILMGVVAVQFRIGRADIRREQEAHQKTRDALLAEIRTGSALADSIREQQAAILAVLKERDRR